jgi:hypothetical protein
MRSPTTTKSSKLEQNKTELRSPGFIHQLFSANTVA